MSGVCPLIVIDTSAVVAILFGEPEAEIFAEAVDQGVVRLIIGRFGARGGDRGRE